MRARPLVVSSFALAATASLAQPACSQSPPALVEEASPADAVPRPSRATFTIASGVLGETRRLHVALPASWARTGPTRRYPVVVVLDGEANLSPVAAVSGELALHGLSPESIVVGIENTSRLRDLTPPGLSVSGSSLNEGGDRFLDFLERELLPAVDRQLRGGAPRTLIGHSSGGILATYAAATRSTWRAVIAIDTPVHLGQSWLAAKMRARAEGSPPPLRYLSYEARFEWPPDEWAALTSAAPRTWLLRREKLAGEAHETLVMLASYLGLRDAFADYSRLAAPVAPTTRILPYYDSVGAALGAPVVPPRRLVRDVVDDLLMEGRGADARRAYGVLAEGYGAPADSAPMLARIADVERRPAPTETVEGLMATPFPTPEEARPFIGEWVGDTWPTPRAPRDGASILRIRIENGRVVGELENTKAPPAFRVRPLEYLRVTRNGLSFGYMNGMRPRGVILYEGVLRGDTLAGRQRFGGVNFEPPPGYDLDPGFELRRVRR